MILNAHSTYVHSNACRIKLKLTLRLFISLSSTVTRPDPALAAARRHPDLSVVWNLSLQPGHVSQCSAPPLGPWRGLSQKRGSPCLAAPRPVQGRVGRAAAALPVVTVPDDHCCRSHTTPPTVLRRGVQLAVHQVILQAVQLAVLQVAQLAGPRSPERRRVFMLNRLSGDLQPASCRSRTPPVATAGFTVMEEAGAAARALLAAASSLLGVEMQENAVCQPVAAPPPAVNQCHDSGTQSGIRAYHYSSKIRAQSRLSEAAGSASRRSQSPQIVRRAGCLAGCLTGCRAGCRVGRVCGVRRPFSAARPARRRIGARLPSCVRSLRAR